VKKGWGGGGERERERGTEREREIFLRSSGPPFAGNLPIITYVGVRESGRVRRREREGRRERERERDDLSA